MVLGKSIVNAIFPSLLAVQMINVGDFIARLDSILLFVWTFGTFLKITICLFAATVNAKVLFGVKEVRTLAFPVGTLMAGLSRILGRNTVDMVDFAVYSWPPYSLPFEVGIPLLILILALVRKRGTKKSPLPASQPGSRGSPRA
jgi:spore germination protein KB